MAPMISDPRTAQQSFAVHKFESGLNAGARVASIYTLQSDDPYQVTPFVADLLADDPSILGFDPVALKQRYDFERERRLRSDGTSQYIRFRPQDADTDERDPYTPWTERDTVDDEVEVVVVGGGFGALLAGAYLRKAGVDDVRLIDVAGDFGGTWYWNRYPNAQCDTESYIYLPLLEDVGYMPTRNYAYAPEIFAHAKAIARKFDLYRKALLQTEVTGATWDEAVARWRVTTDRGDRISARHVILAHGGMTRPKLPNIPGIKNFAGHYFHTARWDYGYTGGTNAGDLAGLTDKRVAIIGTGATAVQCVVPVAKWARELYVFQRTPSSIGVRNNRPTDPQWAASLKPGWQRRRSDQFAAGLEGGDVQEAFPGDGWIPLMSAHRRVIRELRALAHVLTGKQLGHVTANADYVMMNELRSRIDTIVRDPETAELLKPWYRPLCKRPCFHDDYLETFNNPNVHLVDASDGGVERLTESGVQVNGRVYDVDCVIFATGFEVGPDLARRAGFEVRGREGVKLTERWANGYRTHFGATAVGFPNCYFLSRTQTPLPQNIPTLLEEMAEHAAYLIAETKRRGAASIEPAEAGEQMWQDEISSKQRNGERFYRECTPGYFNNEGEVAVKNRFADLYGGGTMRFFELMRAWRARGDLDGMVLR